MALPPTVEDLLERNKQFAQSHQPRPFIKEFRTPEWHQWNTPRILIITCADMRAPPEEILGLKHFEAIIVRNVGGQPAHEMAPILAIDTRVHFKAIIVIHHTDCGTCHYTEEGWRQAVKDRVGGRDQEVNVLSYGGGIAGQDLAQSVRDNVALIKDWPLLPEELAKNVHGFTFDIKSGLLTAV